MRDSKAEGWTDLKRRAKTSPYDDAKGFEGEVRVSSDLNHERASCRTDLVHTLAENPELYHPLEQVVRLEELDT
jgi:hypothetical protein